MSESKDPGPARAGAVVGGIALGAFGAFAYMTLVIVGMLSTSAEPPLLVGFAILAAPAVLGAVLLAVPTTRRAGAGLAIGIAIGLIVLPTVCVLPMAGG